MNSFQIEQLLANVKTFGDVGTEMVGGKDDAEYKVESGDNMPKYYPVYTRPILSENEYVGVMTNLAKFIGSQKSIAKFVDDANVSALLNPAELVLHFVRAGKMDCTIIRNHGAEKVSFSVLKRNPIFEKTMLDHYERKNKSMKEEFYDPIARIEANSK